VVGIAPPPNFARPGTKKAIGAKEAKARVVDRIQEGLKVAEAMATVQRKPETYKSWMQDDAAFRDTINSIREAQSETRHTGRPAVPGFEEFCRDFIHQPLFLHQLQMFDVIEGRPPRDIHPSMDYLPGYPNRVIINVPPEHGKSTTFAVNYSLWRIHKDPNIRIVIMSQGKDLARRFMGEIKFKLTSQQYLPMHMRFAPEGGWKDKLAQWTNDAIYVKGKGTGTREGEIAHPTVQALGLGGQIYGTRSDLIFMDDTITTKNCREIPRQMILLDREIESRLPSEQEGGGQLILLGTRVAPIDLYRTLMEVTDGDDERVWTYFRMPAVLDYGDGKPGTWTTLWPWKWNGPSLSKRKRGTSWALIYQQLNIDDEMTFTAEAVDASVNGLRFPGLMTKIGQGHREGGMDGLYVVAGLDPAATGFSAIVVQALDRATEKRYVLDGWNHRDATASDIINKVKYFTELYGLHEWVIETNALQRFIGQLPELVDFLRARGCKLTKHYTTAKTKFDSDWGISSLGPLFDTCGVPDPSNPSGRWKRTPTKALVELPSPRQNAWVQDLIQQLTTWKPEGMTQKGEKTDLVMAYWFGSLAFSRILNRKKATQTHMSSPFMSVGAKGRQQVIDLVAMRREKQEARDLQGVG